MTPALSFAHNEQNVFCEYTGVSSSTTENLLPKLDSYDTFSHLIPSYNILNSCSVIGAQRQANHVGPATNTKKKRIRTQYLSSQIMALEKLFKTNPYISKYDRALLAQQLQLNELKIKVWFQNRRMKAKKEEKASKDSISNIVSTSSETSLPANATNVFKASEFQQNYDLYDNWNQNQNSELTEALPSPNIDQAIRNIFSNGEEKFGLQNNFSNLQDVLNYLELPSNANTNLLDISETTFVSRLPSMSTNSSFSDYEHSYQN